MCTAGRRMLNPLSTQIVGPARAEAKIDRRPTAIA